jgi:HSP20 family protein
MIRPSIRTYREDRNDHWIDSERHRKHFLGRHSPSIHLPGDPVSVAAANVKRAGKLLELEVVMPGFDKEEISITIENNLLTVIGEKPQEKVRNPEDYMYREFATDRIFRSFEVAEHLLKEDIKASYEQGLLKIVFIDVPEEMERVKQRVEIA